MKIYIILIYLFVLFTFEVQAQYLVPFTGSGTISACSGTIQDHAGNSDYSNSANGYMVINPSVAGNFVRLTFSQFVTESGYDYVTIFDGVGTGGTVLYAATSGSPALPTITSASGSLTIRFTSDGSIVAAGFTANITCVSPTYLVPSSGSTNITTCSGTIQDHAGNSDYTNSVNGYTVIYPNSPNSLVRLTFSQFVTESGYDYVTIFNGVGTAGTILYGPTSGSPALPTVTSTSGPLTIRFTSDGSIVAAGFTANISCVACSPPGIPGFGNNVWNVIGYNSTDLASNYSGYYTDTRLNATTTDRWSQSTLSPSDANATNGAAWSGCYIGPDNHSYRMKRQGFPCGFYNIQVQHDDNYNLLLNGASIHSGACCSNPTAVLSNQFLGANTTLELTIVEGSGDSYGGLILTKTADLAITSSNATMCPTNTRTLTANIAGGTWSVVSGPVSIVGTTLTAGNPSVNTNAVIRYTYQGCTIDQTITINAASTLGTVSNSGPVSFCDATGNFGTPITVSGQTGTVTWDWGSNNGVWNINWVTGASGVCCFPKKTSNSDGNADRIRYQVTNGTCPSVISSTILIPNRYNEAPSSLATSSSSYCANAIPANITLTATFPATINMNGTVAFYSGSCGGTLVGSVVASATSTTAAITITAPSTSTTYFARYEPGVGTGCSNTACASVAVNVTAIPAAPSSVTASPSAICTGASANLNATSSGNIINWYTVSTGGTSVGTSASGANFAVTPGSTTTYYAEATTSTSSNILNSPVHTNTNSGSWTLGYAFTPNTNITVTAVRRYFGSKISIWTNTGTLLTSQAVTGTDGTWSNTTLASPITLTAGVTYRIGAFTNGSNYYWTSTLPNTFAAGTINGSYEISGDAFPTSSDAVAWWFVDLIYSSGTNCLSATRTPVTVTVNTLSTAPTSITGTSTICAGASTTLTLSGGSAGTGAAAQWFTGSCGGTGVSTGNSITVSPASTTTYFVRYSGTCNTTTCASVTVTVNALPAIASATAAASPICANATTTLTANGVSGAGAIVTWWSGTGGTGTNYGTGTTLVAGPGTYYARVTGTCSPAVEASVTVGSNSLSVAPTSITGTTTICAGASTTLTISGGSAGTGATAQWFAGSCGGTSIGSGNSITVSPGSTTTYYVQYIGTCNITTCASTTVTVNPLHTISLSSGSSTPSLCLNTLMSPNTVYTVGGGATGAVISGLPAGLTGNYSAGTFTISGTPSATGTFAYTVTTTGNACTAATATGSITVNALPQVSNFASATGGTSICNGNIGQLVITTSNGVGPFTVIYNDGTSNQTATGVVSGTPFNANPNPTTGTVTYTLVSVTGANGCARTSGFTDGSASISVRQIPTATISGTTTICEGVASPNITFTGTAPGGTNPPYTFTYKINGGADQTVTTVSGSSVTVAVPTATTGTFTYSLVSIAYATNPNCTNTASGSAVVTIIPNHTISLTSGSTNQTVCQSSAIGNIVYAVGGGGTSAGVTGLPAGVTGSFSGGNFTITGIPTASGTFNYTVTTTGNACTVATATGTITVTGTLSLTPSGTNVSCNGGSNGTASVLASGGTGTYTYSWYNGGNTSTKTNLPIGTYTVLVTSGACSGTTSYTVTQPTVLVGNTCVTTSDLCQAGTGAIKVVATGGTAPYNVTWTPATGTASPSSTIATSGGFINIINILGGTTLNVTITDTNGCHTP